MVVDIRQSTGDPIAVDSGNVGIQGRVVSKTLQLPLFTSNRNAVWGGRQHLLKVSYPFAMLQFSANRRMFRLEVGDCFKYSYSKYGISGAVFRVIHKEEQELESENIIINAVEDFYFVSRVIDEYTKPADYTIPRPDYTLSPFVEQMAMEVPFAMTLNTNVEVLPVASRESQFDLGFDAYLSIDGGVSYSLLVNNVGNLVPFGILVDADYPKTYSIDTEIGFVVEFRNSDDAALVETTSWANALAGIENIALLGSEIIFFKAITPVSGLKYKIEDVVRARMDTQKSSHTVGAKFYVLDSDLYFLSHDEIVVGASRKFKLVPYNIRKRGSISDAIPIDLSIVGRLRTPYVPSNFFANGGGFAARYDDDIVLTWDPRYRGKGAGIGVPGVVLSEYSREGYFEIEVWVGGAKVRTTNVIDAATWIYTDAMNYTDNGTLAEVITFKLLNYRTDAGILYESSQAIVTCKKNPAPLS